VGTRLLALALASLAWACPRAEPAGAPTSAPWPHRVWDRRHGLPDQRVLAVCQTRDGFLWIGTRNGLARFDGQSFTAFSRQTHAALPSDLITALVEDRDGSLWIGTPEGLLRWDGRQFRVVPLPVPVPGEVAAVRGLTPARGGGVWVSTAHALVRAQGAESRLVAQGRDGDCAALWEDADGTLWVAGSYTLRRFNAALEEQPGWRHPDHAEGGVGITAAARDAAGRLVVQSQKLNPGAALGGYHRLQLWEVGEGRWQLLHTVPEANSGRPLFLLPLRDGSLLWPDSPSGLERLHDGRLSPIPAPWLPAEEYALCALEDHEGGLWLGTENSGLFRLRQPAFQTLTRTDGLPHDNTWTILPTGGDVWVGTDDGLVRLGEKARGNSLLRDSPPLRDSIAPSGGAGGAPPLHLLAGRRVLALNAEPSGALWIGLGDGLARWAGGRLENVRFPAFWTNTADAQLRQWNKLRCLATTGDGGVWVGLPSGLMQMHAGGGRFYRLVQGRETEVRALLPARDGSLWAGTHGHGLARLQPPPADGPPLLDRIQPGRWEVQPFDAPRLTTRDGLSSDRVWWLHEDADGVLWAGTDHGLNRLAFPRGPTNAPAIFAFTTRHGLPDNLVNYAVEDDHGHLWVAHDRGLYRVAKADLEAVAAGRAATARCVTYDEADGLLSREANGQKSQPAGAKTPDGRLWFCTTHGVGVVDPARVLAAPAPPPPVALDRVVADEELLLGDGADAPDGPSPHLPPGRGRVVEFAYAATSFDAPARLRFQYRLTGYETRWHDAGPRRVAYYTNLDPGAYRFEVRALNREGTPSAAPAAFAFVLRPHGVVLGRRRGRHAGRHHHHCGVAAARDAPAGRSGRARRRAHQPGPRPPR
jgi:ligand-binding sensor domain-containing protein